MITIDYSLTIQDRLDNISKLDMPKSSDNYVLDAFGEKIAFNGNRGLKPAYCQLALTNDHIQEIYKCMNSVEYFFFNYCQVVTSKGFTFGDVRQYQIDLLNFLAVEPRCCLSMPRQSSKSVTAGIHILHQILFKKEITWGLAANKQGMSKEILTKIKQTYSRLPFWLQQGVISWNANSIELENGSKVLTSATTGDSFRGFTLSGGLLVDECAFISPTMWEEFYDSVFPTVSSVKTSQIILASTPKGLNHWHAIWTDAEEKRSEFRPYKINWYDVPGRDDEWLETQIETFGPMYVAQNYQCSFLGSSDTLIDAYSLAQLRRIEPIIRDKFIAGMNIFEDVVEKKKYILSVDTAKDGSDKFALHVIDITKFPFSQVASASLDVSYLKMPKVLLDIATYYNNAFVIIENVEGSGQSIADTLYSVYEYEHLYKDKRKEYPGFRTSKGTRPKILSLLKTFIENKKLIIKDKTTIEQLGTFIKRGGKYQADSGSKDDSVMALAISFAPFLDISAYADYDKFMEALEHLGYEDEEHEYVDIGSLVSVGYFDDGIEFDEERREGIFQLDYNTYHYNDDLDTFG